MNNHYQRQEYRARINRVMDFIQNNLHRPLQLKEIAEVAHFSPYHFHRIFGALVGETLAGFIQRVRVEKAAMRLLADRRRSVIAIALDTGFSTSASLARSFRDHFGMSATQ
ncbi:MAG: helix-turn-helix domain-containing protein [Fibrobacterota bacterium]